jgi:hypothetical protein
MPHDPQLDDDLPRSVAFGNVDSSYLNQESQEMPRRARWLSSRLTSPGEAYGRRAACAQTVDPIQQGFRALFKEVIEIVSTKSLWVDDVGPQDFVHSGSVNTGILLQPGKTDASDQPSFRAASSRVSPSKQ